MTNGSCRHDILDTLFIALGTFLFPLGLGVGGVLVVELLLSLGHRLHAGLRLLLLSGGLGGGDVSLGALFVALVALLLLVRALLAGAGDTR